MVLQVFSVLLSHVYEIKSPSHVVYLHRHLWKSSLNWSNIGCYCCNMSVSSLLNTKEYVVLLQSRSIYEPQEVAEVPKNHQCSAYSVTAELQNLLTLTSAQKPRARGFMAWVSTVKQLLQVVRHLISSIHPSFPAYPIQGRGFNVPYTENDWKKTLWIHKTFN